MTTASPWETLDALFADDPDRAAGLEMIAAVMHGAGQRPWSETLDALAETVRVERARRVTSEPLTPAALLLRGVFTDIHERYTRRQETGQDAIGHSSGFTRFDRILGGLDRGRMSVLLAAPGAGKTTLSNQIAYTVAASGAPVVYLTFENAPDDLVLKQIARIAGKGSSNIRRGQVPPADLQIAYTTFQQGAGQRLFYVTGTAATSIETLRVVLAQVQERYPETYPLVVVDFLQRLATTSTVVGRGSGLDDMRGRVGIIAQQLRELATDTGAHIWAISSTNRAAYNSEKATPTLASARESGDVEFAADHVVTLAPGKSDSLSMTTDPYELGIIKNRHGETGAVAISRERITMRMVETEARVKTFAEQVRASA